jgi:hypothetical protein
MQILFVGLVVLVVLFLVWFFYSSNSEGFSSVASRVRQRKKDRQGRVADRKYLKKILEGQIKRLNKGDPATRVAKTLFDLFSPPVGCEWGPRWPGVCGSGEWEWPHSPQGGPLMLSIAAKAQEIAKGQK